MPLRCPKATVTLFLLASVLFSFSSCGKKGPPFMPQPAFDVRVIQLEGEWTEGFVLLQGIVSDHSGPAAVKGCRINYAIYPVDDPPCEGCPVEYSGHRLFGPEVVSGKKFFCKIPEDKKGEIHIYEVQLIGPNGTLGPPSERIQIAAMGKAE